MAIDELAKERIFDRITENREQLRELGVARLGVFGSVVRGAARPDSDIDFLVIFQPGKKNFDNFMALSFFLEDLVGGHIELVTRESLSPFIGPNILREVEYADLGD